ncbi:glycosyltransferase family 2 protein [Cnuella takakiae]|nr:glycosyltransferase family 2 protein [Cnuella takakiae]OLY94157.1 hypothetical protein BUE76_21400 [Cnuella takakiae]
MKPKVSVLIPTYNYARFLDEAIQSVLAQTYTDFELLIMDNCSTDNTEAVVRPYLQDPRVTYYKNEKNLGLVGNWNKCLDHARGEYIKFLCADDKFHPHLLEKFVAVMEAYPSVMLVTSYNTYFGDRNRERVRPFTGLVNGQEARKHMISEGGKNWIGEPSAVMFRSSGLAVGHFNPKLVALIDKEYWLRLLTMGDCYVIPESLSYFRWHDSAQTAKVRNKMYERTFEVYHYITSIKKFNQEKRINDIPNLDQMIRMRASRVAALVYRTLPFIFRPDYRQVFLRAWQIGKQEHVMFHPLERLVRGEASLKGNKK